MRALTLILRIWGRVKLKKGIKGLRLNPEKFSGINLQGFYWAVVSQTFETLSKVGMPSLEEMASLRDCSRDHFVYLWNNPGNAVHTISKKPFDF